MFEAITKDGKTFLPIERDSIVEAGLLATAQWAQKTAPTKIYRAFPGEDITQASGERMLVQAKGNEVIFDNGNIPIRHNANGQAVEFRRDAFIPTDHTGTPTGADIRDKDYRRIAKGVEQASIPSFSPGSFEARDYGFYLPLPNPKSVVRLDQLRYIPNAFGPGDHQFLDQPVLRLQQKDGQWRVAGGINGPEFKATWTSLGPMDQINQDEAKFHAQLALTKSARSFKLQHIISVIRSLPTRLATGHWLSRPEAPIRVDNKPRLPTDPS